MKLNDLMTFGHVVYSDGNGNVTDEFEDIMHGPEIVYAELDSDGQLTGDPIDMMIWGRVGWELLTGYSIDATRFMSEILHNSQRIGGRLETHIRENTGYYVAVMVDGAELDENDETVSVGWAVAFKEAK
jgi:hypothetical protein